MPGRVHLTVPNGDWDQPVESGDVYLRATVTVPGGEPASEVYRLVLDGPSRMTGFAIVRNGVSIARSRFSKGRRW